MLAKLFTIILFLNSLSLGQSTQLSTVPAPNNEVMTIDPNNCDEDCQKQLLEDGKVFTFISKHNDDSNNTYLRGKYQVLQSIFKLEEAEEKADGLNIAVLVPTTTIGRYASMVTDAISSFLIYKSQDFTIKIYDSKTEDPKALAEKLAEINKDGYRYIIAPLTIEGAERLASLDIDDNIIFIPTINKEDLSITAENIIFGGIDYKEQLKVLSGYERGNKILIFEEPIALSKKLTTYADESIMLPPSVVEIKTKRTNFQEIFESESVDINTTILLNTRPVMTSLILSQLTYYDINVSTVLTTQMNYSPMVLTLTQREDLKNLYVANSITREFDELYEINRLTDNNLLFNWIIYSTSIMTDLIIQDYKDSGMGFSKTFGVAVEDGNIVYPVNVYKLKDKRFLIAPIPTLDEPEEEPETSKEEEFQEAE